MNTRTDFFKAKDMGSGITRISGTGYSFCYLVRGKKSALLVDAMTGLGDLRGYVRKLTPLPVRTAVTHGHFDHCGGMTGFDEAWIPPQDLFLLPEQLKRERQFWFEAQKASSQKQPVDFSPEDFTPLGGTILHAVRDGMEFDLGGRIVTAVALPGHTPGSFGFLDSKTGVFFSGDAASMLTFMFLRHSSPVSVYWKALRRLKATRSHQISQWYNAHHFTEMPESILDDMIRACRDALAGRITGQCFRNNPDLRFVYPVTPRWRRADGRYGNMIVNVRRIG